MAKVRIIDGTTVITGKCRASYAHLDEPHSINGGDAKYSCSVIIPKTETETVDAIKTAIKNAVNNGVSSKWKGKKPGNLRSPLRDGDEERPDDEAYQGAFFLNANSTRQPMILNREARVDNTPELIKSGDWCVFELAFYPYSVSGNNGVAVGLQTVQLKSVGQRLGGRSFNASYFEAEDDQDDDLEDMI